MPKLPLIAHLCTATSWRGGEQQALYLAEGLKDKEIETLVIAQPESPMAERCVQAGIRVECIKCRGEWDLWASWQVSRLLKRCEAGLIHAHDAHAVSIAGRAARSAGIKALCTRRVDFRVRSPRKYLRMERVICISRAIRDICLSAGIPEEKLPIVMSGIDLDRIDNAVADVETMRREFAPDKKKPLLLLNVASLTDHKGQRYLIEAMPTVLAKLPQTQLIIVGDGELEQPLLHQANGLAVEEDVVLVGFSDDVPVMLKSCDLFVMASHLEGLCTSVMDAMAAGKAVVTTTAGGLPEIVDDGRTGLLAEPRNAESLAEKLIELLGNRKKRERFAKAAFDTAHRKFGKQTMVEGTMEVYSQILASSPGNSKQ